MVPAVDALPIGIVDVEGDRPARGTPGLQRKIERAGPWLQSEQQIRALGRAYRIGDERGQKCLLLAKWQPGLAELRRDDLDVPVELSRQKPEAERPAEAVLLHAVREHGESHQP